MVRVQAPLLGREQIISEAAISRPLDLAVPEASMKRDKSKILITLIFEAEMFYFFNARSTNGIQQQFVVMSE